MFPVWKSKTDQSYSSADLPDNFSMTCHPRSYINTVQFSTTRENRLFPCLYRDVVKGQRCHRRREMLWEEGGKRYQRRYVMRGERYQRRDFMTGKWCHERAEVSEEMS